MTIAISTPKLAAMDANEEINHPLIAYENLAASATMSTDVGTETAAAAFGVTGTTYDPWTATPASNIAALRATWGAAQSVSYVAVAAHNIADVGGTVYAEYSTDGGTTWVDSGAGGITPADNQALAFYFVAVSAADWRIRITGLTGEVSLGVAFFGNPIVVPERIYQAYAPPITPNIVDLQSNVSEGGNLLGSATIRRGSQGSAGFNYLTADFVRGDEWLGFQRHYNGCSGFFWAWRPNKYGDLFYAWREGAAIAPSNSGVLDRMSLGMSMRFHDEP